MPQIWTKTAYTAIVLITTLLGNGALYQRAYTRRIRAAGKRDPWKGF